MCSLVFVEVIRTGQGQDHHQESYSWCVPRLPSVQVLYAFEVKFVVPVCGRDSPSTKLRQNRRLSICRQVQSFQAWCTNNEHKLKFFIVRLDAGSQCISNTGSQAPPWQACGYKCEQCRAGVQAGVQSWPIESCNLFFFVISILLCSRWSGWVQGCKLLMC
jgi:hypothetical protein